jgi:hypothetical protein
MSPLIVMGLTLRSRPRQYPTKSAKSPFEKGMKGISPDGEL